MPDTRTHLTPMLAPKKEHPAEKSKLHPRNLHRSRYDFQQLAATHPALAPFVKTNAFEDESIDFANPLAIKALNQALLKQHYGVEHWDIPAGYLCPPIPGRADYLHHIADVMAVANDGKIPRGKKISCLDIGVGASCIYPIIGAKTYGWSFVGSEIDPVALASAEKNIASNPFLKDMATCRLQPDSKSVYQGIIQKDEYFDVSICNPPFHESLEDAHSGNLRKLSNLSGKKTSKPVLNFGGQPGELWCEGGETQFIANMIRESREFATSCFWYSTLVSKQSNLKMVGATLEKAGATKIEILPMGQGNKLTRIVAWSFLSFTQQKAWKNARWR